MTSATHTPAEAEALILKRLRENLLPKQVVQSAGVSYAQVARVIREHGGLNAIKGHPKVQHR